MRQKYALILVALLLPAVFCLGWAKGREQELSKAASFDACDTAHGYAIRYTYHGFERTIAFRVRPVEYAAYCVKTFDVEGWDPDWADTLLSELPDEVVNVVDPKPVRGW